MSWRSVTENYDVDASHAGIIIGPKGSHIKSLKNRPGVINVYLDTRTYSSKCVLQVKAQSKAQCEEVWSSVQREITMRINNPGRVASCMKTFIDAEGNEAVFSPCGDSLPVLPVGFETTVYELDKFRESISSRQKFSNGNTKVVFPQKTDDAIEESFAKSLQLIDFSKIQKFHFDVHVGKVIYLNKTDERGVRNIFRKEDGSLPLFGFKPFYITLLKPDLRDEVFLRLEEHGFSHLNEQSPEQYTNVHMFIEEEKAFFSVKLALDENLEEFQEQANDSRLSEDKRKAINDIFSAATIGEVFDGVLGNSDKIKFRKLCLLLHPDKNMHPGANEAFKILQNAYTAKENGGRDSTKRLAVDRPKRQSSTDEEKPPKVINVKKKKTQVASITIVTNALLDPRASIQTYLVDEEGQDLSERVRSVLNQCWERRDNEGGIPSPDGKTGIFIRQVKQLQAVHVWAKDVTTSQGQGLLEVKVKMMRTRIDNKAQWQNGMEIDLKVKVDGFKTPSTSVLAEKFQIIKDEWDHICPKN